MFKQKKKKTLSASLWAKKLKYNIHYLNFVWFYSCSENDLSHVPIHSFKHPQKKLIGLKVF